MQDYLHRLALALPLICLMAIGALVAWKRIQYRFAGRAAGTGSRPLHGIPIPIWLRRADRDARDSAGSVDRAALTVLRCQTVAPGARLMVVRFGGGDHLIGLSSAGLSRLAECSASHIAPEQDILASIVGSRLQDSRTHFSPAAPTFRNRP